VLVRQQRAEPGAGQESVWDYPRPPALVPSDRHVEVRLGERVLADTSAAYRVLETSHPPGYYLPVADIDPAALRPSAAGSTLCEFKGAARYLDVDGRPAAAWQYPRPSRGYEAIAGHVSFYPALMDACWVGDERVQPQEGDFYGGWVTSAIVGPFKGGPGTWGW
jgi:uncharacterized protein (DUF427 family)